MGNGQFGDDESQEPQNDPDPSCTNDTQLLDAFFSFPGTSSQRGLTFGPSRLPDAPALRDRKALHLLCWQLQKLTGIYFNIYKHIKTQPKLTFIFHENRFFEVLPSISLRAQHGPAMLRVIARPCRARQPERHGETLAAGGQDLVRNVLRGLAQSLGSQWSYGGFLRGTPKMIHKMEFSLNHPAIGVPHIKKMHFEWEKCGKIWQVLEHDWNS